MGETGAACRPHFQSGVAQPLNFGTCSCAPVRYLRGKALSAAFFFFFLWRVSSSRVQVTQRWCWYLRNPTQSSKPGLNKSQVSMVWSNSEKGPVFKMDILSIYLSIVLSIYRSIDLSIYLSTYLSIYLSIYRSIDLSIYRSIDPSIHPSIHTHFNSIWTLCIDVWK